MKEFMFIFRRDPASTKEPQGSPEAMQALWKAWQDWTNGLKATNHFGENGKRLASDGNVVAPNKRVTNGPFVEVKESVVGYMFVRANSLEDATTLAADSPNIGMGGTVEVREVVGSEGAMDNSQ